MEDVLSAMQLAFGRAQMMTGELDARPGLQHIPQLEGIVSYALEIQADLDEESRVVVSPKGAIKIKLEGSLALRSQDDVEDEERS